MKYIFGTFLAAGVLVGGIWLFSALPDTETNQQYVAPAGAFLPTELGNTLSQSGLVTKSESQQGVYILHDETDTEREYTITYVETRDTFYVTLQGKPTEALVDEAEERLIQVLEMPINDVCALNVVVTAGGDEKNIGLSFCP